jgi:hypothetical protein
MFVPRDGGRFGRPVALMFEIPSGFALVVFRRTAIDLGDPH